MDIVGHYYPANASAAATTKMESVLSATLTDLHVRGEVGSCIQSMLLDIETTHHLQQQLELEATHRLLEKAQTEQQGVILEAHAERLERYHRRVDAAELLAWKEAHEDKVRNYDSVMARLAQTEEELKEAQRVSYGGRARPRRAEGDAKPEEETTEPPNADREGAVAADGSETQAKAEPTIQSVPSEQHKAAAGTEAPETGADHETPMETDPTTGTCAEGVVDKNNDDDDDEQLLEDVQKPPAFEEPALVSIDAEADVEEDVPTLMTLDVEPLMNVFGFLDAMDILNTAQINLTMYNKVDNIFGISEDGQSPPVPTPSRSKAAAKPARSAGAPQSTNATTGATQATPATTSTGAATAAAATTTTGGMGKGLFSMLQPAKPEAQTLSAGSGQQHSQPLNAKVAQSMASKLSDAELAAIISMTDKLSKLEKEVHLLRNEKEIYAAKLDGTEAVKQFLIGKVRDVEVKLQRSREDEIKVTQQIASDQEVIAFLDSRVQELEQQTENLTMEKTGAQAGFDDLRVSSTKKITMLSDMLKYEREKVREDESDWKATKKVLVKEVKSCRAQILALQAERDGLKEQNDVLKRAIVSSSGGGSGSGNKHQRKSSIGSPSMMR